MNRLIPIAFSLVAFAPALVPGCGGSPFRGGQDPAAGGAGAGGDSAAGHAHSGAGATTSDAGAPGAAGAGAISGEGGAGGSDLDSETIAVENDADDAVFVAKDAAFERDPDERLGTSLRVGWDGQHWYRAALRFRLPVPKGSRVVSATLELFRTESTGADADADATMRVEVYDSSNVSPFDDGHEHAPEAHDSGGLAGDFVGGFAVGAPGVVTSPDLGALVQRVVERSDYREGNRIAFILSADELTGLATFADSSTSEESSKLHVVYVPP